MAKSLCVLGCGTLGSSIIEGLLEEEKEGQGRITACVVRETSAQRLRQRFGDRISVLAGENGRAVEGADVVLLGCKPQGCRAILTAPGMREGLEGKLLVSILAGTTLEQLRGWTAPTTRVVRAMPNAPCRIRQGMTVIASTPGLMDAAQDRETVLWMFGVIGRTLILEERHLDACTALCGSGPAFAAVVLEAMVDGGVMMGLPRRDAQILAAQTMQGTARMVLGGEEPASIRNAVATPGGCTITGLLTMEDGKIRSTMARTIQEATLLASSLSDSKDAVSKR